MRLAYETLCPKGSALETLRLQAKPEDLAYVTLKRLYHPVIWAADRFRVKLEAITTQLIGGLLHFLKRRRLLNTTFCALTDGL
jgi:hypothetical protein